MEVFRASRRRRPARQQDVVGGAPDPRADRAGRQLAGGAQPAAEPGEGDEPAEGDDRREDRRGARGRARPHRRPPGAGRLGQPDPLATSCSRTRWSRTCAPRSRSATSTAVLDGDLDEFMEGYLRWRRSPERPSEVRWQLPGCQRGLREPPRQPVRDASMIRLENVTKIYNDRGHRAPRRQLRRRQGRVRLPRRSVRLGQVARCCG